MALIFVPFVKNILLIGGHGSLHVETKTDYYCILTLVFKTGNKFLTKLIGYIINFLKRYKSSSLMYKNWIIQYSWK